jgi:hypothetical protein
MIPRRLTGFSLGALALAAIAGIGIASAQSRTSFAGWDEMSRAERARTCLQLRRDAGYFTKKVLSSDKRFIQSQFRQCMKAASTGGHFAQPAPLPPSSAASSPAVSTGSSLTGTSEF